MRLLEMLFVTALVLYSIVVWSHKIKKTLNLWMVWLFGIGLAADAGGTIFLCMAVASRWTFTLHTISGLVSLFIMTLHFIWAFLSIVCGGRFEVYFKRFSVPAYFLWLIAFISGIPL